MKCNDFVRKMRLYIPSWVIIARVIDHKVWNVAFLFFILMPIIALFMKEVPEQILISINGVNYIFHAALPFKWWELYFSALFISIAKGFYIAFSPDFIKEFNDYEDYEKSGRKGGYLEKTLYDLIPFWRHKKPGALDSYVSKFDERIHFLNKSGVDCALGSDLWGNDLKTSFWLVYDVANYSRMLPRVICVAFIAASALFFADLSIDKVLLVLEII